MLPCILLPDIQRRALAKSGRQRINGTLTADKIDDLIGLFIEQKIKIEQHHRSRLAQQQEIYKFKDHDILTVAVFFYKFGCIRPGINHLVSLIAKDNFKVRQLAFKHSGRGGVNRTVAVYYD